MKILYLDLHMGAAGDMLAAALADLLDDTEGFLRELAAMNIPNTEVTLAPLSSGGIIGKSLFVTVNGEEESDCCHGHSLLDIEQIVNSLNTSDGIKRDILGVYNIIAEAESRVHGTPVREIHFHEVGMLDAVADIAAVCLAMKKLSPGKIAASSVHVGSGQVKCAHGILPVPAPATAEILKGIPVYGGKIRGELCTPTGAALLKYFVSEFGNMPTLVMEKTGYGMGKREFETVNCVRAILGDGESHGDVVELRANVDDMTGEDMAYAMEVILNAGALDVWTESIGMKKSRPGVMLCVLCEDADAETMSALMFCHTTTLGVREIKCRRRTLSRRVEEVETELGTVRKKVAEGFGVIREKYEHEDIARLAMGNDMSVSYVRSIVAATDTACSTIVKKQVLRADN